MKSIESRVAQAEASLPGPVEEIHPPGRRTVIFKPLPYFLKRDGFDLAPIQAERPAGPLVPASFEGMRSAAKRREQAREKLKGLNKQEQEALAKRLGFRVIYPENGGRQ